MIDWGKIKCRLGFHDWELHKRLEDREFERFKVTTVYNYENRCSRCEKKKFTFKRIDRSSQ